MDKIQSSSVIYNTTIKNPTNKTAHVSPTARQRLKEGYSTNDKIREQDKLKIEKGLPKKPRRLGSEDRSPRFIKKMTNSNKHTLPKVGHSQTIDCLRQTITKKNDKILTINKTIVTYMNKISEKENQTKAFQDLSQKLKQNLEASSEMLKKVNQMNMHFLSFYKDFENLVKRETRDVISHEDHKFKGLQDQLLIVIRFCDPNSGKWKIDSSDLFEEFDILSKVFRESSQRTAKFLSRKSSYANSKYTVDELSNIASCVSAVDRTHEASSPVSRSSSKDQNSFSWIFSNQVDVEHLRRDIVKLTEENKYLKKRMGSNHLNLAALKCEICPSYLEVIDNLYKEKESIENDLKTQLTRECSKYERADEDLQALKSKCNEEHKELMSKYKIEGELTSEVAILKKKNIDLMSHIKNTLESQDGYEYLQNTVSDLSLALIDKNERDLTHRQIQLIKDLFDEAQIKSIASFKNKITDLETEKQKFVEQCKKMIDKHKEIMNPFKQYAIAIKE